MFELLIFKKKKKKHCYYISILQKLKKKPYIFNYTFIRHEFS